MTAIAGASDSDERLRVEGVAKRYGPITALDHVSLAVKRGEFLTILGPSGSGKTTLLKIIAGFEHADEGEIRLEGRDITFVRPAVRNIGMVFQNYALFPHMTVAENVAFPLVMRRTPKAEIHRRVREALALVELSGYEERRPSPLSGGQQQRVALARAIVFKPPLLLLDEPFGALDRKLREQMQLEVRQLQRRLELTALFVTHDQEEALLISDRIAVMGDGRIHQIEDPKAIYGRPCNRFVADFIGESNLYSAQIIDVVRDGARIRLECGTVLVVADTSHRAGEKVYAVIRPESPVLADGQADNAIPAVVLETIFTGNARKYRLQSADGVELVVRWPSTLGARDFAPGDRVTVAVPPEAVRLVQ